MRQINSRVRKVNIPENFYLVLNTKARRYFDNLFEASREKIIEDVHKKASARVARHPIIRAVKGEFAGDQTGKDLQAELGIPEAFAAQAVTELLDMLTEIIIIEKGDRITNEKSFSYPVRVRIKDVKEFVAQKRSRLASRPFAFASSGKRNKKLVKIYWMLFLLEATDAYVEDYIVSPGLDLSNFGIKFGNYADSRSGRALMTSRELNADRFPYDLSKDYVSVDGKNFIEDALDSETFREQVTNILARQVKRLKGQVRKV